MIHFDEYLAEKFIKLQEQLKPKISIEIGAHEAEFSQLMSKKITKDNTWAFEANPIVYKKYSGFNNFHYINKAISDKNNYIKFELQVGLEDEGNNSIKNRKEDKIYSYIDVESVTLDSMFSDYKNICLWIDCEGANKEVLLGAHQVLKNTDSIFIEVEEIEYWEDQWLDVDVFKYLDDQGFALVEKKEQYEKQYNCIFIKKDLM